MNVGLLASAAAQTRRRVGARATVVVVAVSAAFLACRLALLRRFSPFWDESLYASWALRVHESVGARWVALVNGKLPLLSWLGAAAMGVGLGPLTAVRTVSLLAGAGSALLAGVLAAEVGGRRAGTAAAAVYVILPLAVVHDVMGLMEPLLGMLFAFALLLQVRLASQPTPLTGGLLGVTLFAALLTKETGYLPVVLLPASLIAFDRRAGGRGRLLLRWAMCAGIALACAACAYVLLATSGDWGVYRSTQRTFGTVRSLGSGLEHPLRWFGQAWPGYRPEILGYVTWPLALLIVLGAVASLVRRRPVGMLCLLWLLALFVVDVLFLTNAFARYLVPSGALLAVLAGVGAAEVTVVLQRLVAGRAGVPLAVAVLAAAAAPAVLLDARVLLRPSTAPYPGVSLQEYETGWSAGTGVNRLVAALREAGRTAPVVVTWYGHLPPAVMLDLRDDRTVSFTASAAPFSSLVVTNDVPLPARPGLGTLRRLATFQRPHAGVPLVLYRRGVVWRGSFYTTAAGLRAGLGLPDSGFDAFIARHRAIRAWYLAAASPTG